MEGDRGQEACDSPIIRRDANKHQASCRGSSFNLAHDLLRPSSPNHPDQRSLTAFTKNKASHYFVTAQVVSLDSRDHHVKINMYREKGFLFDQQRWPSTHRQLNTELLRNLLICSGVPQNSPLAPLPHLSFLSHKKGLLTLSPTPLLAAFSSPPCMCSLKTLSIWLFSKPTGLSNKGTSITSSVFSFHFSFPLIRVNGLNASSHVPVRKSESSKLNSQIERLCAVMKLDICDASRRAFSTSMNRNRGK